MKEINLFSDNEEYLPTMRNGFKICSEEEYKGLYSIIKKEINKIKIVDKENPLLIRFVFLNYNKQDNHDQVDSMHSIPNLGLLPVDRYVLTDKKPKFISANNSIYFDKAIVFPVDFKEKKSLEGRLIISKIPNLLTLPAYYQGENLLRKLGENLKGIPK